MGRWGGSERQRAYLQEWSSSKALKFTIHSQHLLQVRDEEAYLERTKGVRTAHSSTDNGFSSFVKLVLLPR